MCVCERASECVCVHVWREMWRFFGAVYGQGVDWGEARMESITGKPVRGAREED